MPDISNYAAIAGQPTIDYLRLLADRLKGKTILNINSTAVGGGVAEILSRMMPFLKQLGVAARWDVIRGNERFFGITKKIHNALHGVATELSADDRDFFIEVNRENADAIDRFGDIVFVHDPQPIGLIARKEQAGGKWLWRCHIDFTAPRPSVMDFLKTFIRRYDYAVFSAPAFAVDMEIPQALISPSIDPLSDKNRDLDSGEIEAVLDRFQIDRRRPVVTQISRFDYLKDPIGVIKAYALVKRYVDCQLVLAGGGATDDPEGDRVLEEVRQAAAADPDIHVLRLAPGSDVEINALQRASSVVLQKSLKEGFGLTVAEALWKKKPVIASAVGGITLQVTHKYSGILTRSIEGTAHYLKQLLNEPEYGARLGRNGYEHIKKNFLITRHIRDYLLLFLAQYHAGDIVYL